MDKDKYDIFVDLATDTIEKCLQKPKGGKY